MSYGNVGLKFIRDFLESKDGLSTSRTTRSVSTNPTKIGAFGELDYRPDEVKAYSSVPIGGLSETRKQIGSSNDIFNSKSPVKLSYIDKFLKEEPVKKPKTSIEKSLTNIAYAQKDLRDAGLDIPEPDVKNVPKRGILERLTDIVSSVPYGLSNAASVQVGSKEEDDIKRLKETAVAFGKGFANFYPFSDKFADDRGSFRDTLKTFMDSDTKNAKLARLALTGRQNEVEAKQAVDMTFGDTDRSVIGRNEEGKLRLQAPSLGWALGTAGDIVIDPMNNIDGYLGAGRALSRGEDFAKSVDTLDNTVDALKAAGMASDVKTAQHTLDKASKMVGKAGKYKGLTYRIPLSHGKEAVIIKAETIGKIGDRLGISALADTVGTPFRALGKTKAVDEVRHLFGGGQFGDLKRYAKANPDQAVKTTITMDMLKDAKKGRKLKIEDYAKEAKKLKTTMDNIDPHLDKQITFLREQGDIRKEVTEIIAETVANPDYLKAVAEKEKVIKSQMTRYKNLIKDMQKTPFARSADGEDYVKVWTNLVGLTKQLDDVAKGSLRLDSASMLGNLEKHLGDEFESIVETLSKGKGNLLDSTYLYTNNMNTVTRELSKLMPVDDARRVAPYLMDSADKTVENIRKMYPEIADFYQGSGTIDFDKFIKEGYENVGEHVIDSVDDVARSVDNFAVPEFQAEIDKVKSDFDARVEKYHKPAYNMYKKGNPDALPFEEWLKKDKYYNQMVENKNKEITDILNKNAKAPDLKKAEDIGGLETPKSDVKGTGKFSDDVYAQKTDTQIKNEDVIKKDIELRNKEKVAAKKPIQIDMDEKVGNYSRKYYENSIKRDARKANIDLPDGLFETKTTQELSEYYAEMRFKARHATQAISEGQEKAVRNIIKKRTNIKEYMTKMEYMVMTKQEKANFLDDFVDQQIDLMRQPGGFNEAYEMIANDKANKAFKAKNQQREFDKALDLNDIPGRNREVKGEEWKNAPDNSKPSMTPKKGELSKEFTGTKEVNDIIDLRNELRKSGLNPDDLDSDVIGKIERGNEVTEIEVAEELNRLRLAKAEQFNTAGKPWKDATEKKLKIDKLRDMMKQLPRTDWEPIIEEQLRKFNIDPDMIKQSGGSTKKTFAKLLESDNKGFYNDASRTVYSKLDMYNKNNKKVNLKAKKPTLLNYAEESIDDIPFNLSDEHDITNHIPGSKKPYQIKVDNITYGSSVDELNIHTFDTPWGKLKVDDKVDPADVNRLVNSLKSESEPIQKALRGSTLEVTNTKVIQELPDGLRKEVYGQNFGRDNIRLYVTDEAIVKPLYQHEAAHNLPVREVNNLQRKLFDEGQALSDDAITEVREALRKSGLANMRVDDDFNEFLKKGYISRYPVALLDYADGKVPTQGSLRLAAKENTAELATLLYHDNPEVSKVIYKHFKESSNQLTEQLALLPEKQIKEMLDMRSDGTVQKILEDKIRKSKEYLDNFIEIKGGNKATLRKYDNVLEKHAEYYKKQRMIELGEVDKLLDETMPKTIDITKNVKHVEVTSRFADMPEEIQEINKFFTESLRGYAEAEELGEEVIEASEFYMAHILSEDLKSTKAGKKLLKEMGIDLSEPFNVHALRRKIEGTISEQNALFHKKSKQEILDYFESSASRIWFQRSVDNANVMYQKEPLKNIMSMFGDEVFDLDLVAGEGADEMGRAFNLAEKLGVDLNVRHAKTQKEVKAIYREALGEKLVSGKYVLVEPNPEWIRDSQLVLDRANIEKLVGKFEGVEDLTEEQLWEFAVEAMKKGQLSSPFSKVDGLSYEKIMRKNPDAKQYLLPTEVAETYDNFIRKSFTDDRNQFEKVFDYLTGIFKVQATVMNPPFHGTNIIGNNYKTYAEFGAETFNPVHTVRSIQAISGKGKFLGNTGEEWLKIARQYGVVDEGIMQEALPNSLKEMNALTKVVPKNPLQKFNEVANPLSRNWKPYQVAGNVGQGIENIDRLKTFFIGIDRGMSIREAADIVDKIQFNYSDLTKFETKYMKRLIPFYTWMRKNIPLQIETMIDKPGRYANIEKVLRAFRQEETESQKKYKPKYMEDSLHLGDGKYLNLNLPGNDLKNATNLRDLASGVNPLLKVPVEIGFNKNLYFDSDIQYRDGAMTKAPNWAIIEIPGLTKKTPKGMMMDPRVKYAIESLLPNSKTLSDIIGFASGKGTEASNQRAVNWFSTQRIHTFDEEKAQQDALNAYTKKLQDEYKNKSYEGYVK